MRNEKEYRLLSDLGRLMSKYGPKAFEDLAADLSDPRFREQLVGILKTTAQASPRPSKGKFSGTSPSSTDFRSTLLRADKEKGALLIELYDALRTRSVLPTLRELKSFASDNGLSPIKSRSREKALIPFVRSFLKLPVEDVRKYLQRIEPTPSPEDRSLQGWSNIIFANRSQVRRA